MAARSLPVPVTQRAHCLRGMAPLGGILILAAGLRLSALTTAPPGFNQDEASNAWNTACLVHTGHDEDGAAWPILYTRGFGENRSALYLYFGLPIQAVGGLSVWTARLPSAITGVAAVFLLYWAVGRLLGPPTGLAAALLLALNPWHIQLSRTGHEAAILPFLSVLALSALIWAGFPPQREPVRPVWWKALIAGATIGLTCYGYPAIRVFVPVFVVACVLVTLPQWLQLRRSRGAMLACGALFLGIVATFGPLAYEHIFHADIIGRRADTLWLWDKADSVPAIVGKILARWAAHFGPGFLFVHGDPYEVQSAAGFGQYHWYLLPLAVVGIGVLIWRFRQSPAARVALCWLVLYPVGDALHTHVIRMPDGSAGVGLHALRSAPGLPALLLVGAVGAVACGQWLHRRGRMALLAAAVAFGLLVVGLNVHFLTYYFTQYPQRFNVYHGYQADLVEALDWVKPRLPQADAAFITTTGMNVPYAVAMVVLGYDPRQWDRDEKDLLHGPWEIYRRVGKLNFMYDRVSFETLQALMKNGRPDHVLFVMRPGEIGLRNPNGSPLVPQHVVRGPGPDGRPQDKLHLFELTL